MCKRFILSVLLSMSISMSWSAVSVEEVMPCNLSSVMDRDYYNFSGYIELKNDADSVVNMNGWEIIHYHRTQKDKYKEKWVWTINSDLELPGKSNTLLWADEGTKIGHIPYKLDVDGGYLLIKRGDELVDSLAYPSMVPHISFGRYNDTVGYMQPSPSRVNTFSVDSLNENTRCVVPEADRVSGLVKEPFLLSLSSGAGNTKIYYTLNGSEPTDSTATLYETPIYLDHGVSVRCRTYETGKLPSTVATYSYIFEDEKHISCGGYTVPIVSITVDSSYFYGDSIGIYIVGKNGVAGEKSCTKTRANYNRDWRRYATFDYIVDGNSVISQDVEVSVEGGCSRKETLKSLQIKTSKKTGAEDFDFYFFESKPDVRHKTLYLRNGGSGYSKVRFRDGLMQTFAIDMNIDYQAFQPVAFYLNGKYMGFMNLNERTNVDYLVANYGIDEDNVDVVTLSDQLGVRASKGDLVAYNELVNYLVNTNAEDSLFYQGACERMDMDEYMDYQVIEQFMVNTDWPGNNTKIWRERTEGSKFRWILFDMDFGLGLAGYLEYSYAERNMFDWCQRKGGGNWANNSGWMTRIFSRLSKNVEFRKKFVEVYKHHLETTFSNEHITAVFDSMTAVMDAEYCATFSKTATVASGGMRNFALKRSGYIYEQMDGYLGVTDVMEVQNRNLPFALLYNGDAENTYSVITEKPIQKVQICNTLGEALQESSMNATLYEFDLNRYPSGVYMVRLNIEGQMVTKKVIKR